MKPLIGITTYYVSNRELGPSFIRGHSGQDMLLSTMDYSRSIEAAGGIPVVLPVINDSNYIKELASRLDGFVFAGGADISPLKYGKNITRDTGLIIPERDDFELSLLEHVLKQNKSVLGICRGFQLINVFFGGTLIQDAWNAGYRQIEHRATMAPKAYPVHDIKIKKGSLIHQAFGSEQLRVNSYHHQIIESLAEGLEETAWSEDKVIEGFQHNEYSFLLGVQWHPEMMTDQIKEQLLLFKLFIKQIKNQKFSDDLFHHH